jgi:hypothetical protein
MSSWMAKTKSKTVIISVLADSEEEANKRITEELNRTGRGHYYRAWIADGSIIEQKPDYHSDCPACLRQLPHTLAEHEQALKRVYESSQADEELPIWMRED